MNLIEKYIEGNENKWLWILLILVGSFLPCIARFFASLSHDIPMFDIKDFLFAGLAMNLSNLNLVGSKNIESKAVLVILSVMLMLIMTLIIGLLLGVETNNGNVIGLIVLDFISIGLVVFSIVMSFTANNYVFKKK